MRITMVGTGYVGLVTGTCFAEIGHTVCCIDTNQEKIRLLKDGVSPIYEPGLEAKIRGNVMKGRLSFTTELEDTIHQSDVVFIAVGTPEGEDGSADLVYVRAVAEEIGALVEHPLLVVVKSTVPVGTCAMVEQLIQKKLADRGLNIRVSVASNPEFLKEGDAINDFMRPDRIVAGVNSDEDAAIFEQVYKPFIMDDPSKLLVMDQRSSELTKYGANAMLATRISFMNELSQLCEKLGADVDSVRRGMGTDTRIGKKFLYAGPGYGGSCFPKDVQALLKTSEQFGVDFSVLKSVSHANELQKNFAAQKILQHFPDLRGKTLAVWGLAFKPGTDDVREAPAKTIIQALVDHGARVRAHDPQAIASFKRSFGDHERVEYSSDAYKVLEGADGLVLITEWSEYRRPEWDRLQALIPGKAIFDLRNQYEAQSVIGAGFYYVCIGRPDSNARALAH